MGGQKGYWHIIIFVILSLTIIFPLLEGKYILTLDTIVSPTSLHAKSFSDFIYGVWVNRPNLGELGIDASRIPLLIVSVALKKLFPTYILQKLEMFLIFFLSMMSMYSLIDTKKYLPKYFAAFLYAINPFTYTRFLAGHWSLLLGYAILPYLLKELLRKELRVKNIVLWLSLISILSTHILVMSFIVMLIFIKKPLRKYVSIAFVFILLNIYWIYPVISAKTITISTIDSGDTEAFMSRNHFVNILFTNAMMYGFWRAEAYFMPSIYLLVPVFIIILYLAVHGAIAGKKTRFALMAVVSLVLAVGIAHPYTEKIFQFLFNIPLMRGFREPNKFVALLALSYSVMGAYGLNKIKRFRAVLLLLPFLFTPLLFMLDTQIKPIDYPPDYYEMNTFINEDKNEFNVLFLPWHLYLDFRWIDNWDKRIANPAAIFFDKPVIQGDNMEIYPVYSHSTDPISKYIEKNMDSAKNLTLINVQYILIAKEYNVSIEDAELIKETENLKLLKNNEKTYKFMQSDDLKKFRKLDYKKISPIKYEVKADSKYIIFTNGYNENWRLDGQKPLEGYPVNIFLNKGTELSYVRFNGILIGYLVSLIVFWFVVLM